MEKECPNCGENVIGRSDKKFCSDQCRSHYNNLQKQDEDIYVRSVISTLRKNRKILARMNPNGKSKVQKNELLLQGFNFKFFTNVYKTKTGNVYYFCFDQGFLKIDEENYALVKRQEFV